MGNSHSHSVPATLHHSASFTEKPRRQAATVREIRKRPSFAAALNCTSSRPFSETAFSASSSQLDRDGRDSDAHGSERPPLHALVSVDLLDDETVSSYKKFLKQYPEYQLTWVVDALRRSDFARLDHAGETYVDFMGGSLYPDSLVRTHTDFLRNNILGNTHSVSNSSRLSATCASEARREILSFFRAPPGYTVIFTPNATGALKLVGESFPFVDGSKYILGADSHNSVHGIRRFAERRGATVHYLESTLRGGVDPEETKALLLEHQPKDSAAAPSLFALTGQSNVTNAKNPLSLLGFAENLGYNTLLDAAALVPTSSFSLTSTPADAVAISFYKMFGFPTGIGALIVKESFLKKLERPWFAGGTVDIVQAPGSIFTMVDNPHEQFEDGTINYLNLCAITEGLRFLSKYIPFLPLRLSSLTHYLISSLSEIHYEGTSKPVVRIVSRRPAKRVMSIGEPSDTGFTISLIFLDVKGEMIPNSFIEHAASARRISLRTGCMCNPGGVTALLDLREEMNKLYPGVTMADFEKYLGIEAGVVRISLGLASNFSDMLKVVQFAESIGRERDRDVMWQAYLADKANGNAGGH
ncbi:PLP-dependent transferase [Abortiporus biennis]|nr:PLP-dependent transferase [Abortiporus biennis]